MCTPFNQLSTDVKKLKRLLEKLLRPNQSLFQMPSPAIFLRSVGYFNRKNFNQYRDIIEKHTNTCQSINQNNLLKIVKTRAS